MNDLEKRIDVLEAIVVVLVKRLRKLESKSLSVKPDKTWFDELLKEASMVKM